MQKCLVLFPGCINKKIYEVLIEKYIDIATNAHGCCVLQPCIDNCPIQYRKKISDLAIEHVFKLINDPYGNYVLQQIIKLKKPEVNQKLCEKLKGNMLKYSLEKIASHTIEIV